jgi:hypothetical protein
MVESDAPQCFCVNVEHSKDHPRLLNRARELQLGTETRWSYHHRFLLSHFQNLPPITTTEAQTNTDVVDCELCTACRDIMTKSANEKKLDEEVSKKARDDLARNVRVGILLAIWMFISISLIM